MAHEMIEQLHSMAAVLDHFEPDEKDHYDDLDQPEGHVYENIIRARDGVQALTDLLEKEVSVFGRKKIAVIEVIFSMDDEEREQYFTLLAEDLSQEGNIDVS